jgi:hypothetical protein
MQIGDWPFCRGKGSHGSIFQVKAQRFEPVYYLENKAGEKIIPPAGDKEIVAMMPGYVQKEARTLPEVRALTKHMDRQSAGKFYAYHSKRIQTKRQNTETNLEFARRAREKMSDPLSRKMTDFAIAKMEDQRRETLPTFNPSGHFEVFE